MNIKLNESNMNKEFRFTEVPLKNNLKAHVYDNCLPIPVFKEIQRKLLGLHFPWHYNEGVLYNKETKYKPFVQPIEGYEDSLDVFQFTHIFFREGDYAWSPATEIIFPILNVLNARAWVRVKSNLGTKESRHLSSGWHYDSFDDKTEPYKDIITGTFCINTNNGYTLLETGDRMESIENRLVLFPCNVLHTGVTQTDTKVRVILTFNFFNKRKIK